MNLAKLSVNLYLILLLMLISGCSQRHESVGKFFDIKYLDCDNSVSIQIRALSSQESINTFCNIDLPSKNIIPVSIIITNETPDTLILRENYIPLKLADPKKVSQLLHWNTSRFLQCSSLLAYLYFWPAIFSICAAGYDMRQQNLKINQEIDDMALEFNEKSQKVKIEPFDKIHRFIFVEKEDLVKQFELKLFNKTLRKLIKFNIQLR